MDKPGRNDPCLCGSGKKYKKCCLDKDNESPFMGNIGEAVQNTIVSSDIKFMYRGLDTIVKKYKDDKSADPLHQYYVYGQHILSMFAELKSDLPEMKQYTNEITRAEEDYQPSGPPMSPLSGSYFTLWAFLDFVFGHNNETIASCLLDSFDALELSDEMRVIIQNMQSSRMGIYEHCGMSGRYVILREVLTNKEYSCLSITGYHGHKGEIWFVRLMPPVSGFDYHVSFCTPYVIVKTTPNDWTHFLNRTIVHAKGEKEESLYNLFKYGKSIHYWNEYIFSAYVNFKFDVIYLTGFPDIKESLPYGRLTEKMRLNCL